jgi:hypothetical protein
MYRLFNVIEMCLTIIPEMRNMIAWFSALLIEMIRTPVPRFRAGRARVG